MMITNMINQLASALTAATVTTPDIIAITGDVNEIVIRLLFGVVLGVCLSAGYIICNKKTYSRNFAISMVVIPGLVASIIWLIGSDITKAISLGGIFALVRFRSLPGDSKDITNVLLAMAVGLAVGLGCYEAAVIITIVAVAVLLLASLTPFAKKGSTEAQLRISIPENLSYDGLFDDILKKYTNSYSLEVVKTAHMGTMFDLTYMVNIKNGVNTKDMIDEIRTKNGNLTIILNSTPKEKGSSVL